MIPAIRSVCPKCGGTLVIETLERGHKYTKYSIDPETGVAESEEQHYDVDEYDVTLSCTHECRLWDLYEGDDWEFDSFDREFLWLKE
jgi:hypothetical protein